MTKKRVTKRKQRKIYGNNIKQILEEIGMSQQELADIVDTNAAHLSKIISGQRRSVSLPVAMDIAAALGKPVEEVFINNEPDNEE